jgi:hypothetical protein
MTKINKAVVQSLWIGPELSAIEQLAINSFLKNGHEFHLYTYDKVKNIPEGTTIKDANEIINSSEIFLYKKSYATFADWFRWELIYKKGNFWVDMDVICLKPFDFKDELIYGFESDYRVPQTVIKFPKGHEIAKYMAYRCKQPFNIFYEDPFRIKLKKFCMKYFLFKKKGDIGWGYAGGPRGFTEVLKNKDLLKLAKPFTYFYPIHVSCAKSIFDLTFKNNPDFLKNSYALHCWNNYLKDHGINKNKTFEKESLIETLKRRYRSKI